MYSLEAGIVDLLMKHNCVVVPGFGGFIGKKIPAKLESASGILIPPSKQFLFNINLIENDGLVLHYLAAKSAVDYFSAEKYVGQKIEEWKNDLQHGRSVTIPNLGIIQKNVNGTMEFTQDADSNLLLQSFGLKELLFVPLEQGIEDEISNSEDAVIVSKKVNLWKYAAARFDNTDTNKDGIVTLEEENAAIAKLKKLEADAKKKQAEQKKESTPAPAPKK